MLINSTNPANFFGGTWFQWGSGRVPVYATGNTNEQEQCNKIAEYAKTELQRCGFEVKKAPEGQAMAKNISESNSWNADLHIPIHTNAYNGKLTGGTQFTSSVSFTIQKKAQIG